MSLTDKRTYGQTTLTLESLCDWKLEYDFWGRGQSPKVQVAKKKLKYILYNVKSTYKAEATATFSILALISEIWAFKIKKWWYFGNKRPIKKSLRMCFGTPFEYFFTLWSKI